MEANAVHENITAALQEKFPNSILFVEEPYGMLTLTIDKKEVLPIIKHLYEKLNFKFLTTLCGMHYQATEDLGVVYHLHDFKKNIRIRLKANFPKAQPVIDSVTSVFKTANWMERETYDFFGIDFIGHPDLRRILNVDEMDYFPMRKEYALEDQKRNDKDDDMFGR